MKILAFTDIHGNAKNLGYVSIAQTIKRLESFKKIVEKEQIDVVLCCGDFTFFNDHVEFVLQKIAELPTEILLIHGNHEDEDEVRILAKQFNNITYLHKKTKKIGTYTFIGYGGGGFSRKDLEFVHSMKKIMEKVDKKEKIIFMSHAPPYGTKIDFRPGYGHVGNHDYREFIEKNNVVLALAGHIHEGFGKEQKLKQARVLDPGPDGKIIELT